MLCTLLSVAFAADPTVGAIVRPEIVVDLPAFDALKDFRYDHKYELHTWMRAFARGEAPRDSNWFIEARLQHHVLVGTDYVVGGGLRGEAWWGLGVGETGWDGKLGGPVRLRVGALSERWGKLDLLPVADILVSRDQRSGLSTPADWQRIPTPMAVVSVASESLRSETVLIPFPTTDLIWLRDTDWSLIRQGWTRRYLQGLSGSAITDDNQNNELYEEILNSATIAVDQMTPQTRRDIDRTILTSGLPDALLYNAELGQRFELSARNFDLALFGGYFRNRQPETVLDEQVRDILRTQQLPDIVIPGQTETTPTGTTAGTGTGTNTGTGETLDLTEAIAVNWPRTFVVGADTAMLAGPIQIRGEVMWQSARVVRTHYLGADHAPNLGAGLGLDYARGSSFGVSLEGRWLHLFTDQMAFGTPEAELLFSRGDQFQVAGGARWTVLDDRVTLQLGGLYDITYQEFMTGGPLLAWRASDHLLLELGGMLLFGLKTPPPTGLDAFGPGEVGALNYTGGIASYWAQNDAASFAATFIW
jgi:hypothetical protein